MDTGQNIRVYRVHKTTVLMLIFTVANPPPLPPSSAPYAVGRASTYFEANITGFAVPVSAEYLLLPNKYSPALLLLYENAISSKGIMRQSE